MVTTPNQVAEIFEEMLAPIRTTISAFDKALDRLDGQVGELATRFAAFEQGANHQIGDLTLLIENMGDWVTSVEAKLPARDIRRRTSTSQSVKGIVTGDQTVETHGYTLDEQLAEFDAQEKAMRDRFPQSPE
jgi:methyl-accepting chemotaxis protein